MSNKKTLAEQLKTTPYTLRLHNFTIDKLNRYAELTDNTTTEVVRIAISEFLKGKTLTNTYLPEVESLSIELPVNQKNYILQKENLFNKINFKEDKTVMVNIQKIPNNLDKFNKNFGYYSQAKDKHSGLEFYILPKLYDPSNNVFSSFFILYFEASSYNLNSIRLLKPVEALNLLNQSENKNLLLKCNSIIKQLEDANNLLISHQELEDELRRLAKKYNTGNVYEVGSNIEIEEETDIDLLTENAKLKLENQELQEYFENQKEYIEKEIPKVVNELIKEYFDEKK